MSMMPLSLREARRAKNDSEDRNHNVQGLAVGRPGGNSEDSGREEVQDESGWWKGESDTLLGNEAPGDKKAKNDRKAEDRIWVGFYWNSRRSAHRGCAVTSLAKSCLLSPFQARGGWHYQSPCS